MKKTLVILKPDAVEQKLIGKIISMIEDNNFTINQMRLANASIDQLRSHYPDSMAEIIAEKMGEAMNKVVSIDEGMNVLNGLRNFMNRGPVVLLEVGGDENVISNFRELVGSTNPASASKTSIRGKYGTDSYAKANKTGRPVENLIHASDSTESAEKELSIWFS